MKNWGKLLLVIGIMVINTNVLSAQVYVVKTTFGSNKSLIFQNTDTEYSYSVYAKGNKRQSEPVTIPPGGSKSRSYDINNHSAKNHDVIVIYDKAAYYNDKQKALNERNRWQRSLDYVECECIPMALRKTNTAKEREAEDYEDITWMKKLGKIIWAGMTNKYYDYSCNDENLLISNLKSIDQNIEVLQSLPYSEQKSKSLARLEREKDRYEYMKAAILFPFIICPEVLSNKKGYESNISILNARIARYDKKFQEGHIVTYDLWKNASNRHLSYEKMPGMGFEYSKQSTLVVLNPKDSMDVVKIDVRQKKSIQNFEGRVFIPFTKSILTKNRENYKRFYGVVGYGQNSIEVYSPDENYIVGYRLGNRLVMLENKGTLDINTQHVTLGLRGIRTYDKNFFSYELGAQKYLMNTVQVNTRQVRYLANGVASQWNAIENISDVENLELTNGNDIIPYLRFSLGFRLLPLSRPRHFPLRRAVVVSVNGGLFGLPGLNKSPVTDLYQFEYDKKTSNISGVEKISIAGVYATLGLTATIFL
ncbi:hypothetical protein [Salmonirosea aquatica]|uniref:Outer membrane protein beta-barrel domain-containing protein n=1 Tax=Salmonirosea aquatica TaxID=2654236 RepID=A0A7C9B9N1_9BACT|nr:hypothetical protein [Cytophagaceae bacterium SJW1-29]